jgi:phosphoribosylanthranilate isomerase
MSEIQIKICGIKTKDAMEAAINYGAAFVGLNFFAPSPRSTTPDNAAQLAALVPPRIKTAAVTVDPDDALLNAILARFKPDFIQLHGKETPKRVAEIKERFGTGIIKALPISEGADFGAMKEYEPLVDRFLFDGKTPPNATLPGGNALAFDWKLMHGQNIAKPWFLAGGLNVTNAKAAVELSGAKALDVSSGVETAPGVKDPALIKALLSTAQSQALRL